VSKLIEDLYEEIYNSEGITECQFDDGWFIAKPCREFGFLAFLKRLKDAWRVLIDKSRAYHFKEDE